MAETVSKFCAISSMVNDTVVALSRQLPDYVFFVVAFYWSNLLPSQILYFREYNKIPEFAQRCSLGLGPRTTPS